MFSTPFFPPSPVSDLAPLFRLLDSATADLVPSTSRAARRASFTPRFDVRELGSSYELQGELPGIEQKDLQIEFVDERTLVIRGRTTHESSSSQNGDEAAATTKAVEAGDAAVDNAEAKTASKYRRPSVQEEEEYVDAGAEASDAPSGANTNASQTEVAEQSQQQQQSKDVTAPSASEQPSFKYWISERSVGEFERRFSFPGRVDQDAVKASLKNGILSVVVPKIVAREARRIQIE